MMRTQGLVHRLVLLAVIALLVPFVGGCANDRKVISQAAQVHTGLQPAVISDPELSQYVQTVGDRVIASAQQMNQEGYHPKKVSKEDSAWMFSKNMQFHFVASDQLNAFTTGGEHMYIYTKLFAQCKSEDELAAVMAHEFAHVYGRHVQNGMNYQTAMLGVTAAAGATGYALASDDNRLAYATSFAGAAAAAGQFVGMGYTRNDEREADAMGFDFYARAGWDPKKFGDFFQHMIDQGYDKTPEMMSDHPTLASRVEVAKQKVAKLPADAPEWRKPPVADKARFAALQGKATKIVKGLPQDDSLKGAKLMLASFPSCVMSEDTKEQKDAQQRLAAILAKSQSK